MTDPMEGGGGPSIMDRMNQGQVGMGGGGGEGGAGDAGGNLIDSLLRLLGINAHSMGGLSALFGDLKAVFSGTTLEGKSVVTTSFDTRGGVIANAAGSVTADAGAAAIHGAGGDIQGNPVDTSGGGGGGGDAQYASLQNMPSAAMDVAAATGQGVQAQHVHDATPAPGGSSAPRRSSRSEGDSLSR